MRKIIFLVLFAFTILHFISPCYSSTPAPITSCSQLSTITNGSYVLNSDLDCSGTKYTPNLTGFCGSIDGQNHTIRGLTTNSSAIFVSNTGTTTISNIYFYNITINSGASAVGTLFGSVTFTISVENVHVYGDNSVANTVKGNRQVGGLIGCIILTTNTASFANCTVSYTVVSGTSTTSGSTSGYVGGIVGLVNSGTIMITDCHNLGFPNNPSATIVQG